MYRFKGIGIYESNISIARKIGVSPETLSRILNRKQLCSKTLAYAITKCVNVKMEINDLFDKE